mmetsp:Transcript_34176/g.78815  ORF Transcript_34176/g.78815 Transcript_34176/m.78815 type:complete len:101 (-) Transcript_34176:166-468(-)
MKLVTLLLPLMLVLFPSSSIMALGMKEVLCNLCGSSKVKGTPSLPEGFALDGLIHGKDAKKFMCKTLRLEYVGKVYLLPKKSCKYMKRYVLDYCGDICAP